MKEMVSKCDEQLQILNKQLYTANKQWSTRFEVGWAVMQDIRLGHILCNQLAVGNTVKNLWIS
jgi:hypothetical protein